MSTKGDANCRVPSSRIKPQFYSKIGFVALEPKTQCIGRGKKSWVFPTLAN